MDEQLGDRSELRLGSNLLASTVPEARQQRLDAILRDYPAPLKDSFSEVLREFGGRYVTSGGTTAFLRGLAFEKRGLEFALIRVRAR